MSISGRAFARIPVLSGEPCPWLFAAPSPNPPSRLFFALGCEKASRARDRVDLAARSAGRGLTGGVRPTARLVDEAAGP